MISIHDPQSTIFLLPPLMTKTMVGIMMIQHSKIVYFDFDAIMSGKPDKPDYVKYINAREDVSKKVWRRIPVTQIKRAILIT